MDSNQIYQNEPAAYKNNNNNYQTISDERLIASLVTLGLDEIIPLFEENAITFVDLLLLSKKDLTEFQLNLYQRNRIWNFASAYKRTAKTYNLDEIIEFFKGHKHFVFNDSIIEGNTLNINKSNTNNFGTSNEKYPQNLNRNIPNNPEQKFSLSTSKEKLVEKNKNDKGNAKKPVCNEIQIQDLETPNIQKINKKNPKSKQNKFQRSEGFNMSGSNNFGSQFGQKNFKGSTDAYTKYLAVKQDADSILEKLSKLKNESEENKYKYNYLFDKVKKPRGGYDKGYGYAPGQNYNQRNNYDEEGLNEEQNEGQMMGFNNKSGPIIENKKENKMMNNNNNMDYNNNMNNYNNNNMNNYNNNKMDYNYGQGYSNEDIEMIYKEIQSKIQKTEKMKLDFCSSKYMEQLKKYMQDKGENLSYKDLEIINQELDKFIGLISRKAELEKSLNECKLSIQAKKRKLGNLDKENFEDQYYNNMDEGCYDDYQQNQGEPVEELEEEYEQESEREGHLRDNSA